jgi:NAD(P) transhydrogenase subunit alpha
MPAADLVVGVVKETADGERRVALTPDGVTRLRALGLQVVVELGAGESALFPDASYVESGAELVDAAELRRTSDISLRIRPPRPEELDDLSKGHVMVGLLEPLAWPERARLLANAKVTAVSLDCLPRTLSRAQSMDVLTSQANVAGYAAALLAASRYDGFFPMLMTAAGTTRPASVLVIGAGVAGLQAIATVRRLGAVVTGSDVRAAAREDVLSTGAAFVQLGAVAGAADDGYARALSDEERRTQQTALAAAVARFDVVITTAQLPGQRPPLLMDSAAVDALRPGSVVIDMAASELGGNVAGSVPDATVVTHHGVHVIGAGNLVGSMPRAASTAYSRNVASLLATLLRDGRIAIDLADEVQAGVVITYDGEVVHPGVLERLALSEATT